MDAMAQVSAALQSAQRKYGANIRMNVIVDNRTVVDGVKAFKNGSTVLPKYGFARWLHMARLLRSLPDVHAHWVPAHDRNDRWRPPFGSVSEWRALNHEADRAADSGRRSSDVHYRVRSLKHKLKWANKWSHTLLTRQHLAALRQINIDNSLLLKWHKRIVEVAF